MKTCKICGGTLIFGDYAHRMCVDELISENNKLGVDLLSSVELLRKKIRKVEYLEEKLNEAYNAAPVSKAGPLRFVLNGCDISFIAEAPSDITLIQLLKQADRIVPEWCACGIRSTRNDEKNIPTEIVFDYDDVRKTSDDVSCKIRQKDDAE